MIAVLHWESSIIWSISIHWSIAKTQVTRFRNLDFISSVAVFNLLFIWGAGLARSEEHPIRFQGHEFEPRLECSDYLKSLAWVAHSVKPPTLDLSSGHDLRVVCSLPSLGSALVMKPIYVKFKKKFFFIFLMFNVIYLDLWMHKS